MYKSTDKFGAYSDKIYVYSSAKYHAIFFLQESGKPVEKRCCDNWTSEACYTNKEEKARITSNAWKKEVFT